MKVARIALLILAFWAGPSVAQESEPSDAEIRQLIVQASLRAYSGSCPCPYNVDRGGRRCGGRSAYSRPGGAAPMCYASDVSDAQVQSYRERLRTESAKREPAE